MLYKHSLRVLLLGLYYKYHTFLASNLKLDIHNNESIEIIFLRTIEIHLKWNFSFLKKIYFVQS